MKWFLLLFILNLSIQSKGQTYSRIYDIVPNAEGNYLKDAIIADTNIFTISSQFCVTDAGLSQCAVFTKFGLTGDILKIKINDSILTLFGGTECLKLYDGQLYHSTTQNGDLERMTYLYEYDLELNFKNIKSYSRINITSNITNEGVHFTGENIYLYGSVQNDADTPDSIQLIKTDIKGNEIWRKYYSYGNSRLNVNSVQTTVDGNLAFILSLHAPAGANKGFNGFQLMKIDTSGAVLDSLVFEDNPTIPLRLLSTSDGSYIFSTLDHPFDGHDIFTTGYGLINKLNLDFDTLDWSLTLPNNQLVDGRHYRMWDYVEASNGDILACGMARDNTDTELATGVPDKNSTWNGFIVRITADGEIVWLRLYKTPNDLLPHDEFGRFRPSRLNKIHELPDGRFLAAGDVFVNSSQNSALLNQGIEANHIWLLILDENGCLDGHDCGEIIRIGDTLRTEISIGSTWTYETRNHPASAIGFQEYTIVDTTFWHGKNAYVIEPGLIDDQDYMIEEDNKIYFWDEELNDYQLNYDFENTSSYYIQYFNPGTNQIDSTIVRIDSIRSVDINGVEHTIQYCRSTFGQGGGVGEMPFEVVRGAGTNYAGVRLPIRFIIDDFTKDVQRLRCYQDDSIDYNFTEVDCDSTWIISSVGEFIPSNIQIFPNPNTGFVNIEGISEDIEYRIRDLSGRIIQQGMSLGQNIEVNNLGMSILEIRDQGRWLRKKIIRIK